MPGILVKRWYLIEKSPEKKKKIKINIFAPKQLKMEIFLTPYHLVSTGIIGMIDQRNLRKFIIFLDNTSIIDAYTMHFNEYTTIIFPRQS